MAAAIIGFSRRFTVVDRLGLPRVPFQQPVPTETTELSAVGWVGIGGNPVVVAAAAFDSTTLAPLAAVGIVVTSRELLKLTSDLTVAYLRDRLACGLAYFIDGQFFDPAVAAIADTNLASVTNDLSPVAKSGSDAAAAAVDFTNLWQAYLDGGGQAEAAAVVMPSRLAVALRLSGHVAFEELTVAGGRLGGLPVFASDSVGAIVAIVDTGRILLADEGQGEIERSTQSSIQMESAPTNGTTHGVSLFQTNSAALKITRTINWQALEGAVAFIDDATYMGVGSPS